VTESANHPVSEPPPLPKYFRVKEALLEQIGSGAWGPGDLIPSEPELCRQFSVSRTTVRKAVSDLVYDGRLVALQGKGTFVATPKVEERFVQRAFGIHEDLERRGITLSTRVLRQGVLDAPPEVARRLRLRSGDPVHVIVRLRSVEQEAILVSTTYIPYSLCPDLSEQELEHVSLYRLLRERYELEIARGERRLEAVAAGPREARLLDVALGSPLLLLESVAYLPDGRPFEHSIALQRGDRTTVELEFFASPDDLPVSLGGPAHRARGSEKHAAELIAASLAETT
jgi:GntR family transcriptional regulator